MKSILQNLSDTFADAGLLEMGVAPSVSPGHRHERDHETLEEIFIEAAFAEAADYDDIREVILRERQSERNISHPDDCPYGDNDLCLV